MIACLLACLMMGSSLLPGFGVEQSTKLVVLIQHFQKHAKTEPGLGFVDFMVMHYGENSEHQKHHDHSHHNLPLAGHAMPVFAPTMLRLGITLPAPVAFLSRVAFFRYTNLYSFLAISSLINPPRR